MKTILILITLSVMSACSNLPPEYSLKSEKYNTDNAGIVVGSINGAGALGAALEITNKANPNITVIYKKAKDFILFLPEGEYKITGLGNFGVAPDSPPLSFTVNKGAINYIGQIELGCNFKTAGANILQQLQGNTNKHWYGTQFCGFLALGECRGVSHDFPVCVFDNQAETVQSAITQNPLLNTLEVKKNLAN